MTLTILCLIALPIASFAQDEGNADIAAMEVMRDVQMDTATKPLKDLETKYREALERKRKSSQDAGNLEAVVAASAELDALAKGDDDATPPRQEDLAKLRQIYQEQKAKLGPQIDASILKVEKEFVRDMNKLVTDLTKSGKTDQAVQVKEKLDEFIKERQEKQEASAAAASAEEDEEEPDGKGIRSLEKILTDGSWSWHTNSLDTPSYGSIRFIEGGKVAGVSWLTGWEALDSSKFKIIFQNNPNSHWIFRLAKDRDSAKTVEMKGVSGDKALKHIKN